jgi:hypothetical protein
MMKTLLLPLLLSGACAAGPLLSLDNRYEATALPVHFDRNAAENHSYFALAAEGKEAQTLSFMRDDSARFNVRNAAWSGDGSLLLERGRAYFGLTAGLSPADKGVSNAGLFLGYGVGIGPVHASLSGGLMLNNTWNSVHYIRVTRDAWFGVIPVSESEDSNRVVKARLEIPMQAGLQVDTRTAFSPFMTASMSQVLIGTGNGGEKVRMLEMTAGVQWDMPRGDALMVQASATQANASVGTVLTGETESRTLAGARIAYAFRL